MHVEDDESVRTAVVAVVVGVFVVVSVGGDGC